MNTLQIKSNKADYSIRENNHNEETTTKVRSQIEKLPGGEKEINIDEPTEAEKFQKYVETKEILKFQEQQGFERCKDNEVLVANFFDTQVKRHKNLTDTNFNSQRGKVMHKVKVKLKMYRSCIGLARYNKTHGFITDRTTSDFITLYRHQNNLPQTSYDDQGNSTEENNNNDEEDESSESSEEQDPINNSGDNDTQKTFGKTQEIPQTQELLAILQSTVGSVDKSEKCI